MLRVHTPLENAVLIYLINKPSRLHDIYLFFNSTKIKGLSNVLAHKSKLSQLLYEMLDNKLLIQIDSKKDIIQKKDYKGLWKVNIKPYHDLYKKGFKNGENAAQGQYEFEHIEKILDCYTKTLTPKKFMKLKLSDTDLFTAALISKITNVSKILYLFEEGKKNSNYDYSKINLKYPPSEFLGEFFGDLYYDDFKIGGIDDFEIYLNEWVSKLSLYLIQEKMSPFNLKS